MTSEVNSNMRKFHVARGFSSDDVILPSRSTQNSAGYDFRSLETYTMKPHERHVFSTGVKAEMEKDEVLYLFIRSSIGIKKGVLLSNSVGVIDSDYFENEKNDGHIMIALSNISDEEVLIQKGDKIAQGVFMKYLVTDDDASTGTRIGGIGSTGK